ncbi:hypothetical protein WA026_020613 [Henosepilachna vigintioctopunctata]|uniref:Uncharacterized protein n=1 Tax=Henosepilachna vigintioctopunctata TaxID=420089 RepID=A0AAW1V4F1_9CUCU
MANLLQSLDEHFTFVMKHKRSMYLILITGSISTNCSELRTDIGKLLYFLWNTHKIFNVVVQVACACSVENIYVFRPFYRHRKGEYGILEVLKMSNDSKNIRRMLNIMRNLHKKPLNISIFERSPTASTNLNIYMTNNFLYQNLFLVKGYAGVDGSVLENLSRLMNFSAELVECVPPTHCYGRVIENGTITGSLGLVANNKVELSANGRFLKNYNTSDIEYTYTIYNDYICAVVRTADLFRAGRIYL